MSRASVLRTFENSLEEPPEPGTLKGDELCSDLDGWSSLAVLAFISAINKEYRVVVPPARMFACKTVDDVLDLIAELTA